MHNGQRIYSSDELLAEIMGFMPCKLVDELYDNMNLLFGTLLEGLLERLTRLAPDKYESLDQQLDIFGKSCEVELDNVFNTFQKYLYHNIWRIPDEANVFPAHFKLLGMPLSENTEQIIADEIKELQQQIIAQKAFQKVLERNIVEKEVELHKLDEYEQFIRKAMCIPQQDTCEKQLMLIKTMKHNLNQLKQTTVASIITSKDVAKKIDDKDARSLYLRDSLKRQLDVFVLPPPKRSKQVST